MALSRLSALGFSSMFSPLYNKEINIYIILYNLLIDSMRFHTSEGSFKSSNLDTSSYRKDIFVEELWEGAYILKLLQVLSHCCFDFVWLSYVSYIILYKCFVFKK